MNRCTKRFVSFEDLFIYFVLIYKCMFPACLISSGNVYSAKPCY